GKALKITGKNKTYNENIEETNDVKSSKGKDRKLTLKSAKGSQPSVKNSKARASKLWNNGGIDVENKDTKSEWSDDIGENTKWRRGKSSKNGNENLFWKPVEKSSMIRQRKSFICSPPIVDLE
uniref:hypothetical protein n=1 Tax=Salmonella sp. s51090 TaxID=3159651 RepID=UPI00397FB24A